MNTQPTPTDSNQPKRRAWNDYEWRDQWMHAISEDEWAAELLADANFPGMERHPYALCGVSLPVFPGDPITGYFPGSEMCPECAALEANQ